MTNFLIVSVDYSITSPAITILKNGKINKVVGFGKTSSCLDKIKILQYPSWNTQEERLFNVAEMLANEIDERPDIIVVEGYAFKGKGPSNNLSEALAFFKSAIIYKFGVIPFKSISPSTMKKFITGSGKASKEEIQEKIDISKTTKKLIETLTKKKKPYDDMIDSIAIGLTFMGLSNRR